MSELSDKIRKEFKENDDVRDALMSTPEDVERWDNIVYGHDDREMQRLDVYRPKQASGIAFGCPAMGDEELEDTVFQPVFEACESKLSGKKVALFGSYGWGDGEWMRSWEEKCQKDGVVLATESVICNEDPDDEAQAACIELGKALC